LYGYFFKQHEQEIAKRRSLNLFLLAVGYLSTVVLGYFSLAQHLQGNDIFYIGGQTYPEEYLSVSVIMMSIAVFNLMMTMKLPKHVVSNTLLIRTTQIFAGLIFGVYLVHPIVMDVLNKFCGVTADSPLMPSLPMYVIVNAVLTLVISTVFALILSYTPLLKKTVGR
jgi:surface polysaccharide O-acyltransferase-like enzyme